MVKKNSVKFQNIEETDSPSTEGSSAGSDADMSSLSSSDSLASGGHNPGSDTMVVDPATTNRTNILPPPLVRNNAHCDAPGPPAVSTLPPVLVRQKVSNGGGDTNILPTVLCRERVGASRSIAPLPTGIALRKPTTPVSTIPAATLPPVPVRQRGPNTTDANALPPVIRREKAVSTIQEQKPVALPPVVKRQRGGDTVLDPSLPPVPARKRSHTDTTPLLPPVIQRRPKNIMPGSSPSQLPMEPGPPVNHQKSKAGLPPLGKPAHLPGQVTSPALALASGVGLPPTNMERNNSRRLPKQALAPAGPARTRKFESPSISEPEQGLSPEASDPLKHRRLGDPRPFNPLSFKPTLNEFNHANQAIRNQAGVVLPYNPGARIAIAHATERLKLQNQLETQLEYVVSNAARVEQVIEGWLKEWDM